MVPDIDWEAFGARLNTIQAQMIHHEETGLCGAEFLGEALRRVLAPLFDGERPEFLVRAEHDRLLQSAIAAHRVAAEHWQAEVSRVRADGFRRLSEAYRAAGRFLRQRAQGVKGKQRQEGVLLAAGWLDPEPDDGQPGR